MPSGKREAAQWRQLTALAGTGPAEIRQRRSAAEQTLAAVRSRLGAAGTYEMPGEPGYAGPGGSPGDYSAYNTGGPGAAQGLAAANQAKGGARGKQWGDVATALGQTTEQGIFDQASVQDTGVITQIDPKYGGKQAVDALGKVTQLNPERAAKAIENTAEFRIMSRLTAESEQLLARQGPLWDSLIKNQQLPIIEGSAAMGKETAENLRRAAAKGGAARRTAFETISKINAQREINTQKMQTIANMRVELDKWSRENARTQIGFNQSWSENIAGVRESYNAAMDNAAALFSSTSLPIMFATTEKSQEWRYFSHAKQRSKLGGWLTGALGVAQAAIGGTAFLKSGGRFGGETMAGGLGTIAAGASGPKAPGMDY